MQTGHFDPAILDEPGTVLIDDRDVQARTGQCFLFSGPYDVLMARAPADVPELLQRLDGHLEAGRFVAGYLAYDAGLLLAGAGTSRHLPSVPAAWFGVYTDCLRLDAESLDLGELGGPEDIGEVRLNITEDEYLDQVARIRDYIAAGDIYQANYTCKLLFQHSRPARLLFARLRAAHPVGHSAFVNTGEMQVVSLSPELFLRRTGNRVLTRPMKGTMRRGRWPEEDAQIARLLASDPKNRAENLMIVDLMRNDLGRVSIVGGVSVPRLFHVERYNTVFQMTSDVEGILRSGIRASDLLLATFPPGSVTGAPKIRAMQIIDETEHEARGVYCGCIGFFGPNGDCLLNVAIRTIVQRGEHCEMGVGGGIVADSDPQAELAEARLKGRFLRSVPKSFELLETLLYKPGQGYAFLEEHLRRMQRSADYLGWSFHEAKAREALAQVAAQAEASRGRSAARVRLLLWPDGSCRAEWAELGPPPHEPVALLLSARRTDPTDIFLYHKTTRRHAYDEDLRAARQRGYFDVLYVNIRGEVTEGAITNVVAEIDGKWYTPPLECGLLPGLWRQSLLDAGQVTERVLTLDDLRRATRVVVGNSVRGGLEVGFIRCDQENGKGPGGVVFRATPLE